MNHFLATTGISEFWNIDSDLVLLGPWCIAEQKNGLLLQGRPYLQVPSPWKPAIKIKEAADICHQIYEETLDELCYRLNLFHGVSYEKKQWRILIGTWLLFFIEILYERYTRIENALSLFPDAYTYTLPKSDCRLVTTDTYDFITLNGQATRDYYNLKLFSLIMYYLYPDKCAEHNLNQPVDADRVFRPDGLAKKMFYRVKKIKDIFYRPDIILSDMYKIGCGQMLSLELCSGPNSICFINFDTVMLDKDCAEYSEGDREKLKLKASQDEFQGLLRQLIPYSIPVCYVENFKKYKVKIKGRAAKIIGSAVGWDFNEKFKFFAAESSLNGTRMVDFQHGGGYGMSLAIPAETSSLEKDIFYTWGWRSENNEKTIPLPSPYLSKLKDTHNKNGESILFAGSTIHKYLCRFFSFFTADDVPQYFLDKKRFVEHMHELPRKELLYKPYPEIGWNETDAIKNMLPGINILSKGKLTDLMQSSKLVVLDFLSTSNLEALTINVPTIWFWDTGIYLLRPEAEKYFDLLRDAGILFNTPEEAAQKVNQIFDDPLRWWLDPRVQEAKNIFCERFAAASSSWRREWADALNKGLL